MNREQQIELARAFLDGEQVQIKVGDEWQDSNCLCLMKNCDSICQAKYRVKPPEPRVIWVNEYTDGDLSVYHHPSHARCKEASMQEHKRQVKFVEVLEDE